MKINQILGAAVAVFALGSTSAFAGAHADGPDPVIEGEGSCTYTLENNFAGPVAVCQEPVGAASCEALGSFAYNADAVHSDGACNLDNLVGTCETGGIKLHYLDGDAGGFEMGCMFSDGEWTSPE